MLDIAQNCPNQVSRTFKL